MRFGPSISGFPDAHAEAVSPFFINTFCGISKKRYVWTLSVYVCYIGIKYSE